MPETNFPDSKTTQNFDKLINFLGLVAGILLVGLTVLICLDVAARTFRLFAMPWSLDVAEYLLYIITFLGAPWVLRDGGHITVDIFVQMLPPAKRRRAIIASNAVGALTCFILFVYAARTWWRSFSENIMVHETFVFPEWYLFSFAPPTFLILFLIFARSVRRGGDMGDSDDRDRAGEPSLDGL